jgi:integrase
MPKQKITRRADGRIQRSKMINGKREYFYGDTQKEVDAKIAARLRQVEAGLKPSEMTVSQWCDRWLDVYASKGYSVMRTHQNITDKIKSQFGEKRVDAVSHMDIKAFAGRCEGYSQTMVNKIRNDTVNIFEAARLNGMIARSPCEGIVWKGKADQTHRALEAWEREALDEAWDAHWFGTCVMLMLYAGLRRGEAVALEWDDIYDGMIHVRRAAHFEGNNTIVEDTTKTPAGQRDIPILPQVQAALDKAQNRGVYVCESAGGNLMTESAFRRGQTSFCRALKKKTGKKIEFRSHDLRHSFATMLYDAGVDVKTAQYLLGHADASVTMKIYTHLSEQRKKSSIDALMDYALARMSKT